MILCTYHGKDIDYYKSNIANEKNSNYVIVSTKESSISNSLLTVNVPYERESEKKNYYSPEILLTLYNEYC